MCIPECSFLSCQRFVYIFNNSTFGAVDVDAPQTHATYNDNIQQCVRSSCTSVATSMSRSNVRAPTRVLIQMWVSSVWFFFVYRRLQCRTLFCLIQNTYFHHILHILTNSETIIKLKESCVPFTPYTSSHRIKHHNSFKQPISLILLSPITTSVWLFSNRLYECI